MFHRAIEIRFSRFDHPFFNAELVRQSLGLEAFFRAVGEEHLFDKGAIGLANVQRRIALVPNDRGPRNAPGLEPNGLTRGDAPCYAQRVERQLLLVTQADHQHAFGRNRAFGWYEQNRLAEFTNEFAAISQGRKNPLHLPVKLFCGAR